MPAARHRRRSSRRRTVCAASRSRTTPRATAAAASAASRRRVRAAPSRARHRRQHATFEPAGHDRSRRTARSAAASTDQGGNVEDQNRRAASRAASRARPTRSSRRRSTRSQPPVLAIPATSPAVDFADCGGRTLDQRGVPRPQGAPLRRRRVRVQPRPGHGDRGGRAAVHVQRDRGRLDVRVLARRCAVHGVRSAVRPRRRARVRTRSRCGRSTRRATPMRPRPPRRSPFSRTRRPRRHADPDADPDPPTPVVNRTIVVGPARGTVKVKVPGAKRFVELDSTIGIPVGSSVDTRKGRVTLTSIPKAGAPPETADVLRRAVQGHAVAAGSPT